MGCRVINLSTNLARSILWPWLGHTCTDLALPSPLPLSTSPEDYLTFSFIVWTFLHPLLVTNMKSDIFSNPSHTLTL